MGDSAILHRLLRETREAAGLTLRDVAEAIGVAPATLCRVENGKCPDVATALRICRWLDVSVEYAMGESERRASSRCSHCAVLARRLARVAEIAGDD